MLRFYTEIMFMCIGIWILPGPAFAPWTNYICGAFMVALSIIKIIGS